MTLLEAENGMKMLGTGLEAFLKDGDPARAAHGSSFMSEERSTPV